MTRNVTTYSEAVERTRQRFEADGYDVSAGSHAGMSGVDSFGDDIEIDLVARRTAGGATETTLILVAPWPRDDIAQQRIASLRSLKECHPELRVRVVSFHPPAPPAVAPSETTRELIRAARELLPESPIAALSLAAQVLEQVLARIATAYGVALPQAVAADRQCVEGLALQGCLSASDATGLLAFVAACERVLMPGNRVGSDHSPGTTDSGAISWVLCFAEQCDYGNEPSTSAMIEWFVARHESPDTAGLPIDPDTGAWEWLGTGPVDCHEALAAQYPAVRAERLMTAVAHIETDGTQWVRMDTQPAGDGEGHPLVEASPEQRTHATGSGDLPSQATPTNSGATALRLGATHVHARAHLVARHHLLAWADTYGARHLLPELIRRLVIETCGSQTHAVFPSDEGVDISGFDGIVRAQSRARWVPDGTSVWELSTSRQVGSKANADYEARTAAPPDWRQSDVSYVAVALRPWPKRHEWAAERTADGRWQEVRAFGIDDLTAWLAACPRSELWLAEQLGLRPDEFESAGSWWRRRLDATGGLYNDAVVLAGRDREARWLGDCIAQGVSPLSVEASSPDEALEFIAAVGTGSSPDDEPLIERMIFVHGSGAWDRLIAEPCPAMVLVAANPELGKRERSTRHTVVLPAATRGTPVAGHPRVVDAPGVIRIGPPDSRLVAEALDSEAARARDIDFDRAQELGSLGRRSLAALRRRLTTGPANEIPSWAPDSETETGKRAKTAALLAGEWTVQPEGVRPSWNDRAVVAELAGDGHSYESVELALDDLTTGSDPLVSRADASWQLASPSETWAMLGPRLVTLAALERFRAAIATVLGEAHAAESLGGAERGTAQMQGESPTHSRSLRRGLARSLVFLSVLGDDLPVPTSVDPSSQARRLVRRLLCPADELTATARAIRLAELGDVLPLLAEAAPDEFVEGLQAAVTPMGDASRTLFGDRAGPDGYPQSASPHTAILWAIETLAWLPSQLSNVADLLFRLHVLDPGGRLANRPVSTFASVFSAWAPQTGASSSARLEALRGLTERLAVPSTGAEALTALTQLLSSLMIGTHSHVMPGSRPRVRDYDLPPARQGSGVISDYVAEVAQLLLRTLRVRVVEHEDIGGVLDMLDAGGARTTAALLPTTARDQFWHLVEQSAHQSAGDELETLRLRLAELVRIHRSYADSDWALPANEVDRLAAVASQLPTSDSDPVETHLWLFQTYHPPLGPDLTLRTGFERYETALRRKRIDAVREVFRRQGLEGVRSLAVQERISERAPSSVVIGAALAEQFGNDGHPTPPHPDDGNALLPADVDQQLLALLDCDPEPDDADLHPSKREFDLAYGYFGARFRGFQEHESSSGAHNAEGWRWLRALAHRDGLSAWQQAWLFESSRDFPSAWNNAAMLGESVLAAYWRVLNWGGLGHDFQYLEEVARGLLSVDRYGDAINLLATYRGGSLLASETRCGLTRAALLGHAHARSGMNGGDADPWCIQQVIADLAIANPVTEDNLDDPRQVQDIMLQFAYSELWESDEELALVHGRMALDPRLFLEFIELCYRRADDESSEHQPANDVATGEQQADGQRQMAAYRVLSAWQRPPGLDDSGALDEERLRSWLDRARKLLEEADRRDIGEEHIGKVLAQAPPDLADNIAPPLAVRQLLEEGQGASFENGLRMGLCFGPGMARGGLVSGLRDEALRAEEQARQDATRLAARWPVTARLLRQVAEAHAQDARMWQADLDHPGR